MLPTPSTSHVNYSHIYEPAEDSYLLLDTLSAPSETDFLRRRFPLKSATPLVVEVGTGSGVVLAFVTAQAQRIFGRKDVFSIGIDVNAYACKASGETVRKAVVESSDQAGCFLGIIQSDLAGSLTEKATDVLIFNPPYVPTEELPTHAVPCTLDLETGNKLSYDAQFQRDSHLLSLSYAGGLDGMETTNRLLDQLTNVLSDRGVAYILLCAQNKPDAVIARIQTWSDKWSAAKVRESGKTAGWEKLCIVRIWRHDQDIS